MKSEIKFSTIHKESDECKAFGCCVHNITNHHMRDWPQNWRGDRQMMERICPHGIGHPDPDQLSYWDRHPPKNGDDGTHGCDGCCTI